jgi:hypothetical protein
MFVVHDIEGDSGGAVLWQGLASLFENQSSLHRMRIDAAALGLENLAPADRRQVFLQTLTLVRDPHANPRQHRLIADAILRGLRAEGPTIPLKRER